MKNVNIQEYYSLVTEKVPRVIVLTYNGEDDPVDQLNKAVAECERAGFVYKEYIDANMDNPWQRILLLRPHSTTNSYHYSIHFQTEKMAKEKLTYPTGKNPVIYKERYKKGTLINDNPRLRTMLDLPGTTVEIQEAGRYHDDKEYFIVKLDKIDVDALEKALKAKHSKDLLASLKTQQVEGFPTASEMQKMIEDGFESELNGETVNDVVTLAKLGDGRVKYTFSIWDRHRQSIMTGNSVTVSKNKVAVSLHEAYEGGGIEDYIIAEVTKWYAK